MANQKVEKKFSVLVVMQVAVRIDGAMRIDEDTSNIEALKLAAKELPKVQDASVYVGPDTEEPETREMITKCAAVFGLEETMRILRMQLPEGVKSFETRENKSLPLTTVKAN